MRRLLALLTTVLALGVPAAASAQVASTPIATLERSSPVSAYGGRLAWSRYDATTRRYQLVSRAGGVTADVPVAPRSVAFDVDLGPDAGGAVVAVYSRCTTEISASSSFVPSLYQRGRGCDLYRFDFATGQERAIAAANSTEGSEVWPTIWRDTIAFVRAYDAKRDYPYLYTRSLSASGASVRQPGGPRSAGAGDPRRSRPYSLDLYGRRLGFVWSYLGSHEGFDTDIRVDTIGGGHQRIAHQNGGGLTQVSLGGTAFQDGRVYWAAACFGDPGGCPGRYGLRRVRLSTGELQTATSPAGLIAHARDAGVTSLVVDTQPGTECLGDPGVAGGTCRLEASSPTYG